ncbi:MAG TPA: efflux RND transporter periplasmic adaptor subunit [Terriglobales bacterium]|nr:efflux RND transporter periplasmic adaptor subunit [Terriglobales bacterium]
MDLRRKYALPIAGSAFICVIAGLVISGRARANTPPGVNSRVVARAAVALVHRGTIENTLSIAGEFLPFQEVELHAKVAGYIQKINVDIGDRVHRGQVLAILEVPELAAQVQGADADVRHSQDEIVRAQNEVARAEADHESLHAEAIRLKQASQARPGLVAQQELDDALAKDRAAEAQVEAAKSALSAARQQLDVAKATHLQVSAMSDYSRIVAPFDGVVTWRYADTGALVQAGTSTNSAQPVVKIAEVDVLRLRIPVPESLAASVHDDQPAEISVQATGEHFAGKVSRLTGALDPSTRTEQVEIDVPNQKLHLAPGMFADVVLQVERHDSALLVPVQAVNRAGDQALALVVGSDHRVHVTPIRTGLEDPNSIEVVSGLREGDRVIVANLGSYQNGQTVDPRVSVFNSEAASGGAH